MAEKRQSSHGVPTHENHGNSVAAWAAVAIMMVGFLLLVIGWVRRNDAPLYITGAVVIIVGLAVGKVLQLLGYGIKHD